MREAEKPKIPYALEFPAGIEFRANLADIDDIEYSAWRTDAYLRRGQNREARFRCPGCRERIYPKGGFLVGRHWSHFDDDRRLCIYETKRPLSDDDVSRLIFDGRQEGQQHETLRLKMVSLLVNDPQTTPASCTTNTYLKPEEGSGCYPDVKAKHHGEQFVFEIQLAPVSLTTIARRWSFYNRQRHILLWVTKNFDPTCILNIFKWDVSSSQNCYVFSLDDDVIALINIDHRVRLRAWRYLGKNWTNEIILLSKIYYDEIHNFIVVDTFWADEFKERWIERAHLSYYDCYDMLDEIFERISGRLIDPSKEFNLNELTRLINVMISIEQGKPIGTKNKNLKEIINTLINNQNGYIYYKIILPVMKAHTPALLEWSKLRKQEQTEKSALDTRYVFLNSIRAALFPSLR